MNAVFRNVCTTILFVFLAAAQLFAQNDPDPNSPTPVLLSGMDQNRVLATMSNRGLQSIPRNGPQVFQPGSANTIALYVSNLSLMPGEGANSIRVYVRQKSGKTYEMQVLDLARVNKSIYAIKVRLFDAEGFRGQPLADGDSLIYLTWRGLASNFLRIGLGSTNNAIEIPSSENNRVISKVPAAEFVGYRWSGDRMRFLEQATFGPSSELDNRVRRIGIRTWMAEQFDTPYPTMPMPNPPQMPSNMPSDCTLTTNPTCYRDRYTMTPLQQWFFKEAFYGNAQMRNRFAWALSQIWVTSGVSIQQSSHEIAYYKILLNDAFGNYRDLMYDATLSPTMGNYLDMVRSTKNNPNENYPREILQLFSIGLFMLNQDGTLQLDGQGNPIPTYNQDTINNFSKVFTGWTYCNTPGTCANASPGVLNYKDPMIVSPANHDTTSKTLLSYPNAVSQTIPACSNCTTPDATAAYADQSLRAALDNIFNHPNVGPYIGKLLIQHLVTSDPSPAYVSRVAAAFNNNGSGVRGDMKAVLRAILLDPEARGDVKTAPRYGKLREPVQLITNLGRIFPAKDYNGTSLSDGALHNQSGTLGQNPFYSPTVFNFFLPDYIIPGSTILAPEFEILNNGTGVGRTNLLSVLIFDGITANATDSLRGTSLDFSEALPLAEADATGNQLLDFLNAKMMHGTLSAGQRNAVLNAVLAIPTTNSLLRVKTAVYLLAASSQYQIQR